jgi:hypothetical protein
MSGRRANAVLALGLGSAAGSAGSVRQRTMAGEAAGDSPEKSPKRGFFVCGGWMASVNVRGSQDRRNE